MVKKSILSILTFFAFTAFALAQQSILVLNSSTKTVAQLNATTGAVINAGFIDLTSQSAGTIKGVTQVDNKIWISDQTQDRIYIYTLAGVYESTIPNTGLDNLRGLNVVGNEVWVTIGGGQNGATNNSVARYSKTGVSLGFYPTVTSPFDVLDLGNGSALVTSFSTAGIQKISYNGATTSAFVPSGVISNPEQLNFNNAGNVICSVFSSLGSNPVGVYEFSSTGSILNTWPVNEGTLRGVIATFGSDYLVSTSSGVYSLNTSTGVTSLILAGNFQFFTKINTSLSTNETETSTSVQIYPNPVQDVLHITSKVDLRDIDIISPTGQIVKRTMAKGKEIKLNISELESGMFMVKVQDKNLKIETFKIIKK